MGDPRVMMTWTHKVLVNGDLLTVGTEEHCNEQAAALEHRGFASPEEIEVVPMDGTEPIC